MQRTLVPRLKYGKLMKMATNTRKSLMEFFIKMVDVNFAYAIVTIRLVTLSPPGQSGGFLL